jgi:hypothetical protein
VGHKQCYVVGAAQFPASEDCFENANQADDQVAKATAPKKVIEVVLETRVDEDNQTENVEDCAKY